MYGLLNICTCHIHIEKSNSQNRISCHHNKSKNNHRVFLQSNKIRKPFKSWNSLNTLEYTLTTQSHMQYWLWFKRYFQKRNDSKGQLIGSKSVFQMNVFRPPQICLQILSLLCAQLRKADYNFPTYECNLYDPKNMPEVKILIIQWKNRTHNK